MTDSPWFVSLNGAQLEGQHSVAEVQQLAADNPGGALLVWRQGMASWQSPDTLAEFRPASTPTAEPAPVQAAPAAVARAPKVDLGAQMGFLRSLFNFSFDSFVTPKMISVLYAIAMLAIAIGCLVMLVGGVGSLISAVRFYRGVGPVLMSLLWILLAPILSLLYLAFARMFFELVVVLFKIKDNTAN